LENNNPKTVATNRQKAITNIILIVYI